MWREDCYELCTLIKQRQKKQKIRKKNIDSFQQRNQIANCHSVGPPQIECLKTIFETQKEMCKAMFQIGHKILEINYPVNQQPIYKSKSCDHKNQFRKIKAQSTKKLKKFGPKLVSKLEDIEETKQEDQSGNTNNKLNNDSYVKNYECANRFENQDYFISGLVKNTRQRMKSTTSSKKSKSTQLTPLKKCLSHSSKSKSKKSKR